MSQEGGSGAIRTSSSWRHPSLTVIPSWFLSLILHATLLFLFASNIRSCTDSSVGVAEGEYRDVGIYVQQSEDLASETEPSEQPSTDVSVAATAIDSSVDTTLADEPPAELMIPQPTLPTLGAGGPPSVVPNSLAELPNSRRGLPRPAAPQNVGPGTAQFFGSQDRGSRIVYVIDSSASMFNNNAFRAAKTELMASLQGLEKTQRFQVIFYNNKPIQMSLRGTKKDSLVWATDINREYANQFIRTVSPDGGTNHLPALRMALSHEPDVLFFLTDADSELYVDEFEKIKRLNRAGTHIHCIEFGKGGELPVGNFLKRLADEHDGMYRYLNVNRFSGR